MYNEADLKILVTNVVSENRSSNCRLCLRHIQESFVRFEDYVVLGQDATEFLRMSDILQKVLGDEIGDEIPGVDVVCMNCVDKALESCKFIENCRKSTMLLNNLFDNLTETLNVDIAISSNDQRLYLVVNEKESSIVLFRDDGKNKSPKYKVHCQECEKTFNDIVELKNHNLTQHNLMMCESCQQTFPSYEELESHVCTGKLKCSDCNEQRSTEKSMKDHYERAHSVFLCKDCGKSCTGLDRLKSHEEKHGSRSQCPRCGKSYLTKDFFTKHVQLCMEDRIEQHPYRAKIKKTFICNTCGKGYSTSGGLRVHERFMHGNAKPHECEVCGKKFTAQSYLKTHMVKHSGEKNFKCEICGNNFVSKEALLYHTRRHTGEKPYSCKFCDARFVNASARAEHIKFKHTEPKYTCDVCSNKFFTVGFLKQHMKRHFDSSSKLFTGRMNIPPNVPGEQNMRRKIEETPWCL